VTAILDARRTGPLTSSAPEGRVDARVGSRRRFSSTTLVLMALCLLTMVASVIWLAVSPSAAPVGLLATAIIAITGWLTSAD
jgi:fatty acid desaturase